MSEPALRFLEYAFLALLYLFFLRVVRAVWAELREPRTVPAPAPPGATAPGGARAAPPGGRDRGGKDRGQPRRLVVVGPGRSAGPAFPLSSELTIGRAPECAVALPDDNFVSHLHARLFLKGHEYWVEDLGSTNGTLVNGKRVTSAVPVRRGDRLQVGRTVLELQR